MVSGMDKSTKRCLGGTKMKFTKTLLKRAHRVEDYHMQNQIAMAQMEQLMRIADSLEKIEIEMFKRNIK